MKHIFTKQFILQTELQIGPSQVFERLPLTFPSWIPHLLGFAPFQLTPNALNTLQLFKASLAMLIPPTTDIPLSSFHSLLSPGLTHQKNSNDLSELHLFSNINCRWYHSVLYTIGKYQCKQYGQTIYLQHACTVHKAQRLQ